MLVLSRRPEEKILFPNLGITVHILRVKGNVVRVGVDAPSEVTVLREELQNGQAIAPARKSWLHTLRNQLNKLGLSLHVVDRQIQMGKSDDARKSLENTLQFLESLDQEWSQLTQPGVTPARTEPSWRTLLVEDDTNERELLAGLLRMHGCDCDVAGDGVDALDYLSTHERPDVVLLDMWMPRCDGPQTLKQIRSNPRYEGLKVFAISGSSPDELGLETGPKGIDAWLPKPLNPRRLWDIMREQLPK